MFYVNTANDSNIFEQFDGIDYLNECIGGFDNLLANEFIMHESVGEKLKDLIDRLIKFIKEACAKVVAAFKKIKTYVMNSKAQQMIKNIPNVKSALDKLDVLDESGMLIVEAADDKNGDPKKKKKFKLHGYDYEHIEDGMTAVDILTKFIETSPELRAPLQAIADGKDDEEIERLTEKAKDAIQEQINKATHGDYSIDEPDLKTKIQEKFGAHLRGKEHEALTKTMVYKQLDGLKAYSEFIKTKDVAKSYEKLEDQYTKILEKVKQGDTEYAEKSVQKKRAALKIYHGLVFALLVGLVIFIIANLGTFSNYVARFMRWFMGVSGHSTTVTYDMDILGHHTYGTDVIKSGFDGTAADAFKMLPDYFKGAPIPKPFG